MRQKLIDITNRTLIIILCLISVSSAILSSIPVARADSSGILGTNAALGSPILNENFTVDNWNKWEMICWGVFLSNFCQPLIDNYESAFKTGAGGSDGAGYKALCFGSGSDYANKEVVEAFCDYAIVQQKSAGMRDVFVTFTYVECSSVANNWKIDDSNSDPNISDTAARKAHFSDFFFLAKDIGNISDVNSTRTSSDMVNIAFGSNNYDFNDQYTNVAHIGKVYVPTFWIQNMDGKYVKILDFMDNWDLQVMSLMINSIRNSDYESKFDSEFDSLYHDKNDVDYISDTDDLVKMDVFGNLIVADKMLFPAANNQNITTDKSINLLNSWMFNSYNSTYSSDQLLTGLSTQDAGWGIADMGGQPAFTESKIGNAALLYYDLDSIMVSDYTENQDMGEALQKLFRLDINRKDNKYPLEVEITNTNNKYSVGIGKIDPVPMTSLTASFLVNMPSSVRPVQVQPEMLTSLVAMDGSKVGLYESNPVIVAPLTDDEETKYLYNFLYRVTNKDIVNTAVGDLSQFKDIFGFSKSKDIADFINKTFIDSFKSVYTKFKNSKVVLPNKIDRLCLVYPVSDVLKSVSSVLGCADGTEFSTYSTMIYMTYLDWYGVSNTTSFTSATEHTSRFNPEIYNNDSPVLPEDPYSVYDGLKTKEEKEEEVLEMSYLMLHPEKGREYRKELIYNGITDFLYEQYNRIVYGGSSDSYNGSASKSNSGFLAVETYSENWLTSWFLESYVDIAVWLIAICVVLLVVMGLLKSRKLSWYLFGLFTIVTVILIVPSSGELVPYITSNFVQNMFSSKMTAWSIAEGVTNASIEADAATQSNGMSQLDSDEAEIAVKLIKQLNVVYIDRSLMLKQDISQKLTQQLGGVYTEIQQLQSARWVLPMIMQQFTNEEDEYGSLYVKLSNVWDDASNLYWYYKPNDVTCMTKPTTTSQQFSNINGEPIAKTASDIEKEKMVGFFADYIQPIWKDDTSTDINYANYSYSISPFDDSMIVHNYAWVLPDTTRLLATKRNSVFGTDYTNYENVDSWQLYIDKAVESSPTLEYWKTTRIDNNIENTNGVTAGFEQIADQYDRANASTLRAGYSFYKHTESPFYYFFNVVKDSFPESSTVGSIVGRIQGNIEEDEYKNKVRTNFMYATVTSDIEKDSSTTGKVTNSDVKYTGYTRDCLDLQFFFNNVVPYMYQITLMTGGFDGESGILVDKTTGEPLKISDESDYYKGNNQSWAYRCNWAVKLMENPDFCKPLTVKDSAGNRVTIKNPILPDSYPTSRPMIFSEAQMIAEGLQESDLNVVELKCIEVNKEVAKQWTLLINYAGVDGLTKEVLFRQMATDATMVFTREFSSSGLMNNLYNIYPQSIDLRYLSFDSVMKMLMLNVSKDTSYIYGDTMSTLIETTDTVTAALLLVSAFLCAYLVPLARTILMAMIFYLGFIAIIRALFSSAKYKGKVACGQLISNLLFMAYTLVYYACFSGLMAVSSSDEVLSVNTVNSNAGNPVWVLLATILASGVYVVCMWKQICFCFKNFRDMGFEMYSQVASAVTGKIGDAIGSLGGSLSGFFDSEGSSTASKTSYNNSSVKGTGIMKDKPQDVVVRQTTGSNITVSQTTDDTDNDISEDTMTTAYASEEVVESTDVITEDDINAEIEAGKQMDSDS